MNRILNKKTVGGTILALLVLMVFCSRTIYSYNLPAVTGVKPQNGRLTKRETASGTVEYSTSEGIYAAVTGKVAEVLVAEGARVEAGDALLRMLFDRDETERKLQELAGSATKLAGDIRSTQMGLEKIRLNIQSARLRRERIEAQRAELLAETYEADEYELEVLLLDIARAEDELAYTEALFALDEVSARDLEKAEAALEALQMRRENMEKNLRLQAERAAETRAATLRGYESDLAAIEIELLSLELDLQMRELDLQAKEVERKSLALQEEACQKILRDFDANVTITASVSGVVTSLHVARGEQVSVNRLLASIGVGGAFTLSCAISDDNDFVAAGDRCRVSNAVRSLWGTVSRVESDGEGKRAYIDLSFDDMAAGERFDITFEKESGSAFLLVPNGAVNQDNDGYYVNQLKRRDGLLGKEHYLERVGIYIGDSDASNTVVTGGITFFEPIVHLSDKAVSPGDTVTLTNAGDFFED